MSDEVTAIEREIEAYIQRLRRLAWYQRRIICPAFFIAGIITTYQLYYSREIWDAASLVVCVAAVVTNYIGARRTIVRLVKYKLGHSDGET